MQPWRSGSQVEHSVACTALPAYPAMDRSRFRAPRITVLFGVKGGPEHTCILLPLHLYLQLSTEHMGKHEPARNCSAVRSPPLEIYLSVVSVKSARGSRSGRQEGSYRVACKPMVSLPKPIAAAPATILQQTFQALQRAHVMPKPDDRTVA